MTSASRVVAVLGPTNTGKTHYAIDRMLGYRTGIMGFPLRLLAREVYDKIVKLRGPSVVALVTGEERIVPPRAQYWICTVEAMPEGMGCDFLAIDEIQLCADLERGHVFTDRLLRSRGLKETLFLGADTAKPRHPHVHHDAAALPGLIAVEKRLRCGEAFYVEIYRFQQPLQGVTYILVIINHVNNLLRGTAHIGCIHRYWVLG